MGDRDTGHWPLLFMMSSKSSSSKSTEEEERSKVRKVKNTLRIPIPDTVAEKYGLFVVLVSSLYAAPRYREAQSHKSIVRN